MTKYSKLRGIAANVLERIAIAATRASDKLAAHQQRNTINENQNETVEESNSKECNRRQVNMENIIGQVPQYFSSNEVQQQIDLVKISPELPQNMLRTHDGNISSAINRSMSQNGQERQETCFDALHVADELNHSSKYLPTNDKNHKSATVPARKCEAQTPARMKIDCSLKEEQRHSNISRPKKRQRILRFNNLSRMRTFQNDSELQSRYPEHLVSTFQGNRKTKQNRSSSKSNQVSPDSSEMIKLSNAGTVSKFQTSNAKRPERKTKSVRFNDVSRMVTFDNDESIPPSFEENLISTFKTDKLLGKRKRYNSLQDEYNSET